MTEKTLLDAFERNHVSRIVAKPGDGYDHNLHEGDPGRRARGHRAGANRPDGRRGYRLHDRLIKPATVIVAQAAEAAEATAEDKGEDRAEDAAGDAEADTDA